ncbi:hypothetical protein GCM10027084_08320 [Pseudoxanthomonas sangjuensis]|uniref:ammonium transporter n=1 Tax=Pseudoxanthomonas sangjuensis TaxID=1503750 RepID=UPI00139186CF|nr:ammonium transporter [Pseudoxanthomonas sangjuensis]KAF1714844.1 ammonium transporter [Pseudoxanthomonas sangjuensis]
MNANPVSRDAWKNIRAALVIAGVQIGGALLLTFLRKQGVIDGETTTRGVMVLIGLGLAAYGNRMPKSLEGPPPPSPGLAATRQAVQRVGGWAMTLAGLAYAGLWAFASRDVALVGSLVVVGASVAVTLGYIAWRVCSGHRSSVS